MLNSSTPIYVVCYIKEYRDHDVEMLHLYLLTLLFLIVFYGIAIVLSHIYRFKIKWIDCVLALPNAFTVSIPIFKKTTTHLYYSSHHSLSTVLSLLLLLLLLLLLSIVVNCWNMIHIITKSYFSSSSSLSLSLSPSEVSGEDNITPISTSSSLFSSSPSLS